MKSSRYILKEYAITSINGVSAVIKILSPFSLKGRQGTPITAVLSVSGTEEIKYSIKKTLQIRNTMSPGNTNILHVPLIKRDKFLMQPLHMKLGLLKKYRECTRQRPICF